MSHAHLSLRHLLKQLESDRSNRTKRDIRPAWLCEFVELAAELFEPLADVGRVGFDCRLDEAGWSTDLYLGSVEIVGGKQDGQSHQAAFHFDLKTLLGRFTQIDDVTWTVQPEQIQTSQVGQSSNVSITGRIGDHPLRLTIRSAARSVVPPGLRQSLDGRFETV